MANWHPDHIPSTKFTARERRRPGSVRPFPDFHVPSIRMYEVAEHEQDVLERSSWALWARLYIPHKNLRTKKVISKNYMCKIKNQLTDFKIWRSMVLLLNTENSLHSICLMEFKSLLGMLNSSKNYIQKIKIQNLLHSPSSIGPSVSMEMPLAKAPDKVSHIMAWFNSFLVSKNQLASTRSIG